MAENGHDDNGRGSYWPKTVTPVSAVLKICIIVFGKSYYKARYKNNCNPKKNTYNKQSKINFYYNLQVSLKYPLFIIFILNWFNLVIDHYYSSNNQCPPLITDNLILTVSYSLNIGCGLKILLPFDSFYFWSCYCTIYEWPRHYSFYIINISPSQK